MEERIERIGTTGIRSTEPPSAGSRSRSPAVHGRAGAWWAHVGLASRRLECSKLLIFEVNQSGTERALQVPAAGSGTRDSHGASEAAKIVGGALLGQPRVGVEVFRSVSR